MIDLTPEHNVVDLIRRARAVKYKNRISRFPTNPTSSTIAGFNKRLNNWIRGLEILEKERAQQKS